MTNRGQLLAEVTGFFANFIQALKKLSGFLASYHFLSTE